jgi:cyclophilin family peptidyl-prolyl cis-trans isomerase
MSIQSVNPVNGKLVKSYEEETEKKNYRQNREGPKSMAKVEGKSLSAKSFFIIKHGKSSERA